MEQEIQISNGSVLDTCKWCNMKMPVKLPVGKPTINPAVSSVKMMFDAYMDYKKSQESEKTKRESISAQRDVAVERIRAQKEFAQKYLELAFHERRDTIKNFFERLDKGIETGNDMLISTSMQAIVDTVKSSPIQGILELKQQIADSSIEYIDI